MKTQEILGTAKEHLLQGGHLPPTFFVKFKGKQRPLIAVIVSTCEHVDAYDQIAQFFLAARKAAKQGRWKREEIKKLFFVAEAMAELPGAAEASEILLMTTLRIASMQMTVQCVEKIQGDAGDLLDLFCHPEMPCTNDVLLAFLDGIESAMLSEKELMAMLRRKRR